MTDEGFINTLKSMVGKRIATSPSPFANWLNGELLEVEQGFVIISYTVRPELCNPMGILHGGAVAGIIDDIMGLMVYTLRNDKFFTTISLQVDYLASAKIGETIKAESKLVKQGSRLIYTEAKVYREDGKLMATGRSQLIDAFLERKPEKPRI